LRQDGRHFPSWATGRIPEHEEAIQVFRDARVRAVVSADYYWTNNLSVLSRRSPVFVSDNWTPDDALALALSEDTVGLIVGAAQQSPFEFLGARFALDRELLRKDDRAYYLGRRLR
jgi:hypothetical protein